jgi:hypothetical protein
MFPTGTKQADARTERLLLLHEAVARPGSTGSALIPVAEVRGADGAAPSRVAFRLSWLLFSKVACTLTTRSGLHARNGEAHEPR